MIDDQLRDFLFEKAAAYNNPSFIEADPICIPHRYSNKKDIEIAGFLSATIAWGQRKTIINNGVKLMQLMDDSPYEFTREFSSRSKEARRLRDFCHRTFNGIDLSYFIKALNHIYKEHKDMESVFAKYPKNMNLAIDHFREVFLSYNAPARTYKHVSSPASGSAAKRINMFLRWMVRKDNAGVDFGIWKKVDAANLMCPLDVHSGRVGRMLGLLKRHQNDWKAVEELTASLRILDSKDPVRFDFALFGIGVNEKF